MLKKFWDLEALGRVQLSRSFYMRDFLYSEIAAAYGITNEPVYPDRAIENGKRLCADILEPLSDAFGRIHIRSGYRSPTLNDFGHRKGLKCASNEKNYAHHIWDFPDTDGLRGATACIVIPSFNERRSSEVTLRHLAGWIDANLPYHRMTFFKNQGAFNIGWHQRPAREIYSYAEPSGWLLRRGQLALTPLPTISPSALGANMVGEWSGYK